jgi:RNA polymerase-binding protein DksA
MTSKDRKTFEKLLQEKRSTLLKELGILEENNLNTTTKDAGGELSSYSYHLADQATDFSEREKAFHLASREGRFLHHIDEALRRVKTKEYGLCMSCGKPINVERLKALPHARFCISCKSKEEERKRKGLE